VHSKHLRRLTVRGTGDGRGRQPVGPAGDADAAAEQATATRPDAVVIDVRMHGGGGPRAALLIGHAVLAGPAP
jgi:DNA-binding NarL/FixJ family response regulator